MHDEQDLSSFVVRDDRVGLGVRSFGRKLVEVRARKTRGNCHIVPIAIGIPHKDMVDITWRGDYKAMTCEDIFFCHLTQKRPHVGILSITILYLLFIKRF